MGSARRFRKQLNLAEIADAAEAVLRNVNVALSKFEMALSTSKPVSPMELDEHFAYASEAANELFEFNRALDVMHRAPWKRPGMPWLEIIAMQNAEKERRPTKRDAALNRVRSAAVAAVTAVWEHHYNHVHRDNFEKFKAGVDHHDPAEREMWDQHVANLTPFASWRLIRRLPHPPKKRGRREGSGGYQEADSKVRAELNKLIEEGERPLAAARQLVDQIPGGGTPESKARRLTRRLPRAENKSG